MKKIVFHNLSLYNSVLTKNLKSYNDYKAALYNYNSNVDYEEYDSEIKLPLKSYPYLSNFKILKVNKQYTESSSKIRYEVYIDTIKYENAEDNSIQLILQPNDYLCLDNENIIYKVIDIRNEFNYNTLKTDNIIIIEEFIGHIALQTFEENQNMILKLYNNNFEKFNYVELPLEENQYICVFIGSIYNNVRSELSDGILLDLSTINMLDANGNIMYSKIDSTKPMNYMEYYDLYCKNIGDLLFGFVETAYPQLSNYSKPELNDLQNSDIIQNIVSESINTEDILSVELINSHLIDDTSSQNIIDLHKQKSELNTKLTDLQSNIDIVYNQLLTTDFSQEINLTQHSLQMQLEEYYTERTIIQKQIIDIINNINTIKGTNSSIEKNKFRIRGVTNTETLEKYLHDNYGKKCDLIGLEIQYKYKSINKNNTKVVDNNNNIFTNWQEVNNKDKQRHMVFDDNIEQYIIEYDNYDKLANIVKWNQIDIPINRGEDVVVKIRYKYSIGQPFINVYTPWSNELTVSFPVDLMEATELSNILVDNDNDVVSAKFNSTLINEGYQEHITNKIVDNSQIFYHMPENIYSGFNTPENKLISLKDKLNEIMNELTVYKSLVDSELNNKILITLEFDNNVIELHNATDNKISINESDIINNDNFIRKNMNIVIKNTGSIPIKLYSIFPGNTNIPLLMNNEQYNSLYIGNYERVPLLVGNSNNPLENIYMQTMGQWIYFRQNDAYSRKDIYLNNYQDIDSSLKAMIDYKPEYNTPSNISFTTNINNYLPLNNKQQLLGYKYHGELLDSNLANYISRNKLTWNELKYNEDTGTIEITNEENSQIFNILNKYTQVDANFFLPINEDTYKLGNSKLNNYLLCYEHICKIYNNGNKQEIKFLSQGTSISNFIASDSTFSKNTDIAGAFLIPWLTNDQLLKCNKFDSNQYYTLNIGEVLSIPVVFEYYIPSDLGEKTDLKDYTLGNTFKYIYKTLAFDIKTSVMKDPMHYSFTVTANYNYTTQNTSSNYNTEQVYEDSLMS